MKKFLGAETDHAVAEFAEAFIKSMPTGAQNAYAHGTCQDAIYVTIREDQPVNLCGAFEKPIRSSEGYVEASKRALCELSLIHILEILALRMNGIKLDTLLMQVSA